MQKRRSPRWLETNTQWRLAALDQILAWAAESYPEMTQPQLAQLRRIAIKRFSWLETFVYSFFPEAPPAPFDPYDAAALIVLPRGQALRLARKLFEGGPGIMKDLRSDDLTSFNMDWFRPQGFH